jgi:hypothetical protein
MPEMNGRYLTKILPTSITTIGLPSPTALADIKNPGTQSARNSLQ